MSLEADRLADYLDHVLQAIDRIRRYVGAIDEAAFLRDELVQDAVIRNLEIIGEASHSIETRFPAFALAHPALPLAFAYQMRNAVAHGYYKVDLGIVWRTIVADLPGFRDSVQAAVDELTAARHAPPEV
jgi:uncharacterized protein with HEPN domain